MRNSALEATDVSRLVGSDRKKEGKIIRPIVFIQINWINKTSTLRAAADYHLEKKNISHLTHDNMPLLWLHPHKHTPEAPVELISVDVFKRVC